MQSDGLSIISKLLGASVEGLDISPDQFDLAERRYQDLSRWLVDQGIDDPDVYPQGSFRLGTVLRPTVAHDFDIDLVFLRFVAKTSVTQAELRDQAGALLRAYIAERGALNGNPSLQEKGRCWTLTYKDDSFHMDVLPVIPDLDGDDTAVLLSDRDLFEWQHSNPIGYADWFWESMGDIVATGRANLAAILNRDVEDVPRWLVRTTLQRVVQLLKLHRDVFFSEQPEMKPPSILITTLATFPYGGEGDLYEAYRKISFELTTHIEQRGDELWVPNPAQPEENFADKWNTNPERKARFDAWAQALISDAEGWATSIGIDGASQALAKSLGASPVQAATRRVASSLAAVAGTGGLSVTSRGTVNETGSGSPIHRHDFHGGH